MSENEVEQIKIGRVNFQRGETRKEVTTIIMDGFRFLPASAIAKLFGRDKSTILKWTKKLGIVGMELKPNEIRELKRLDYSAYGTSRTLLFDIDDLGKLSEVMSIKLIELPQKGDHDNA